MRNSLEEKLFQALVDAQLWGTSVRPFLFPRYFSPAPVHYGTNSRIGFIEVRCSITIAICFRRSLGVGTNEVKETIDNVVSGC